MGKPGAVPLIVGVSIALLLLLSPLVVVRANDVASFSARQLNVAHADPVAFEEASRFLAGGDVYQVLFDRDANRDFTIVWPGTISEDAPEVQLDVWDFVSSRLVRSYTRSANEPWQVTLPGAIKYVRVQITARITLLHSNGTKAWSSFLDFRDIRPEPHFHSNAAIVSLSAGRSVEIKAIATRFNYTCQWAAETRVTGFVGGPSSSSVLTVLQAPLEYRNDLGMHCQVPLELETRAAAPAHFAMSLLVGSGPDTVPPADGVPIVKPTRPRVLSIATTNACLSPGDGLLVIGIFNTSALYSCDFSVATGPYSLVVAASSQPERAQSQWDLMCTIPTELTRNQFVLLRRVTVRQWPDAGASDSERLLVGGLFFHSYCPAVFWYYSKTFWYEVGAAVGVLALVVFAAVVIVRRRARAYKPVSLEMDSVA